MSGRKDWFFVSDAAKSRLRIALEEADAQGALAVLAEVHRGFDFRPVLAAGTGNVTRRELTMVRDGQDWREGRDPKARAEIDVDAAPESPGLDARDTGARSAARCAGSPRKGRATLRRDAAAHAATGRSADRRRCRRCGFRRWQA